MVKIKTQHLSIERLKRVIDGMGWLICLCHRIVLWDRRHKLLGDISS